MFLNSKIQQNRKVNIFSAIGIIFIALIYMIIDFKVNDYLINFILLLIFLIFSLAIFNIILFRYISSNVRNDDSSFNKYRFLRNRVLISLSILACFIFVKLI